MRTSFWTYFTSAYGTFWLVLLGISLITQSHIDAGPFGLIGFPILALCYAWVRRSGDKDHDGKRGQNPIAPHHPKLGEFLRVHPEFMTAATHVRDHAFRRWLENQEKNRDPEDPSDHASR